MTKIITKVFAVVLFYGLLFSGCSDEKVDSTIELETFQDSLSYSFGVMLAQNLKGETQDIDVALVAQALKETLEEKEQLNLEQCQGILVAYSQEKIAASKEEGLAYLEENAKKDGVKSTASGLQYKILKEGTGDYPTAENKVKVHYTGTLIDGTEFDSSVGRDPISFSLNGVITGWTEGLQLINEGGKIELTIPYPLAYGERGSGQIPPNATLIFEVELLSIEE